ILDKESARLFVNDLLSLNAGEECPPGAPYSGYLAWLKGQNAAEEEDFWRQTLAEIRSPTPLTMERRATGARSEPGDYAEQTRPLPPALVERIERLVSGREGLAAALLHAAWALLLSRYSGEEEVIVGTRVDTCPAHLLASGLALGPFTNALPVRLAVSQGMSVKDWIARVEAELRSVQAHAHTSLATIHRLADPPVATSLFDSCVDGGTGRRGDIVGRRYGPVTLRDLSDGRPEFPLVLPSVLQFGILRIGYERRRFEDDAMARVLEHLESLIDGLAGESDRPLSALSLLTAATERQLLVEWNDTSKPYPADECIHWLFEPPVQKTPPLAPP